MGINEFKFQIYKGGGSEHVLEQWEALTDKSAVIVAEDNPGIEKDTALWFEEDRKSVRAANIFIVQSSGEEGVVVRRADGEDFPPVREPEKGEVFHQIAKVTQKKV